MAGPQPEHVRSGRVEMAGWAAFLLRCTVGVTFLAHGIQKIVILGWVGGVSGFRSWNIPLADITYPLTVLVEAGGGLLLLAGLWVRPAAAALTVVMLGALFTVHLRHGFFLPDGFEFVLVLGTACVAIVLLGPGRWALGPRLPFGSSGRWLHGEGGRSR